MTVLEFIHLFHKRQRYAANTKCSLTKSYWLAREPKILWKSICANPLYSAESGENFIVKYQFLYIVMTLYLIAWHDVVSPQFLYRVIELTIYQNKNTETDLAWLTEVILTKFFRDSFFCTVTWINFAIVLVKCELTRLSLTACEIIDFILNLEFRMLAFFCELNYYLCIHHPFDICILQ